MSNLKKHFSNYIAVNYAEAPNSCDYGFSSPARTLSPDYLGHHGDWVIYGRTREDYYIWVNNFSAKNLRTGEWVKGNFEGMVYASSWKALKRFLKLFPYQEWDYYDI